MPRLHSFRNNPKPIHTISKCIEIKKIQTFIYLFIFNFAFKTDVMTVVIFEWTRMTISELEIYFRYQSWRTLLLVENRGINFMKEYILKLKLLRTVIALLKWE